MRRSVAALALLFAVGGVVGAQPTVRFTLKSGETVSAQLIDLNAEGFIVRSGGESRRIAKNDVAVLTFDGSEVPEIDDVDGRHAMVLKNGNVVRGELVDVGGIDPLRLSFRSGSGVQDYTSNDVRRIVFDRPRSTRPPAATPNPPPPPPLPGDGRAVRVPADQRWTSTGIAVRRGQRITFAASGEIQLALGGAPRSGPDGTSNRDPGSPIPGTPTGTLIGRVDPGRLRIAAHPFAIGASGTVVMPNDGTLQLGVNDSELSDNRGAFEVRVRRTESRR